MLAGNGSNINPLGDNLLPLLVLAIAGALVVGHVLALVKPPQRPTGEAGATLPHASRRRSLTMIAIGLFGALWALATLLSR